MPLPPAAPMQLMRARDIQTKPSDRVFRYSRVGAAAFVVLMLVSASALFDLGVRDAALFPKVLAVFFCLVLLVSWRTCKARFRSSNWLVRTTQGGLYVQFRSYLNFHFSGDDRTVVFIPWREISSAQLVHETLLVPEVKVRIDGKIPSGEAPRRVPRKVVELQLTCDTAPLDQALFAERARLAPAVRRWFGTTRTRAEHNPVLLDEAHRLHVTWEVVPSVAAFLKTLAPYVKLETEAAREWSYAALQELDRGALEWRIGELARTGQMRQARLLTRLRFAYDDDQAREFIERARNAPVKLSA